MLPKVTGPEDVKKVDAVLEFLERKHGIPVGSILIDPVLETAQGMRQAYEVAIASPRVAHLGGITGKDGDIARAIGFQWTPEGHEAFFYISKVLLDARAANIPYPIGGRDGGISPTSTASAKRPSARATSATPVCSSSTRRTSPLSTKFSRRRRSKSPIGKN